MELDTQSFFERKSKPIFFFGSLLTSFGILLVTVGGSWDITNHLLNKPETFFSPSHAFLYTGVTIALIGVIISFFSWRNLHQSKPVFLIAIKFKLLGIALLVGSGPFDFVWHLNFGLDGLLSPPHLTLITGMILCGVGGMIGISRFVQTSLQNHRSSFYLLILAVLPVWLSCAGMVSSLSLPFSNTDYFEFNPEPTFGLIMAMAGFPILISVSTLTASSLSGYRFGILSLLGGLFLLIYSSTAIIPNFALLDSIQFYSFNVIPFLVVDLMVSNKNSRIVIIISGGILGSIFYLVYYPYIMYTFNEVMLGRLVSPSMIYEIYFQLIKTVYLYSVIPAIFLGMIGSIFSQKISKKILANSNL